MTQTPKRIVFSLLVVSSIFLPTMPVFAQSVPADLASLAPSDNLATGDSYFGINLGITGSDYIGSENFLFGIVTSRLLGTAYPKLPPIFHTTALEAELDLWVDLKPVSH